MRKSVFVCSALLMAGTAFAQGDKPNIVLIMCDDMGYSDLGCYGSEIQTPHIDALAEDGVRFSNFKNTGRCCPSRASLLTGRHQHAVGLGWMTAVDEHRPGYRGQIADTIPTLAEIMKENGYSTYMAGKWHVTVDGAWKPKDSTPNGSYPTERGFDEFYGGLTGGGNYYKPKSIHRNEEKITTFPEGYYYTDAITDHAVAFIQNHDATKPFFMYVAHYAPHRPLQAPEERIDACRERYKVGYDLLRQERYRRLKEIGLIKSAVELPIHTGEFKKQARPSWDALDAKLKEEWIEEMATYAAMIEIMDDWIGEVVEEVKKRGEFDNTLFVFLSDNGATSEGGFISQLAADLSNTPYRSYKAKTFMGGISSPLIIHYPKKIKKGAGGVRADSTHITDILPTCLDLAGIEYPKTFNGAEIAPPDGISVVPALKNEALPERDFFFEHQTACSAISGDWKLVRLSTGWSWELIHLKEDPFEQNDVAKAYPEKVAELEEKWNAWGEKNNVLPLNPKGLSWDNRVKKYTEQYPVQDGREGNNK
ncbi:sulfatase-like hydrolase/transferase [Pontiella desulfatans]